MKILNRFISIAIVISLTSIILVACTSNSRSGLAISGSTSVEKLTKSFSEAYTEKYDDIDFTVEGGGSGAAISNVSDNVSDIGVLSRNLKTEEKEKNFKETTIAIDGIAVVVNPSNKVRDLSSDQIKKIFSGEINNWKDVGGDDMPIVVVGREAGSGTRDGFEEILGIKDNTKYGIELNETGQIKAQVSSTNGAIGYVSTGYIDSSISALKVDSIDPSLDNIQSKTYPIQRPFIMIHKPDNESKEKIEKFLEFILSSEGQAIVKDKGFVPIS